MINISGRYYCYYNKRGIFDIGENDIVFFTRNRGIINIEVKGKIIYQ